MQDLLAIGGCTAVGKSAFALKLSEYLNMEIISADSVQVYKGLEIATSKPTHKERAICKHHLVDIIGLFDTFNAYDFVKKATQAIDEIAKLNKLPVIVGGTGLYIDSLLFGFDFQSNKHQKNFDYEYIFYNDEREKIYRRINIRVDNMIKNGLVDEVKTLRSMGVSKNEQCMQAIGYKEIGDYLEGNCSLDEAITLIKKNTRNYAKRQTTWFKNNGAVMWMTKDEDALIKYLLNRFSQYKKA
ncbi:MAG: tRNA dimethylallyltransferase [Clostridia bacterium]|nr:tRNA dimethylallyltransferase [Clostridia bacterium]